MNPRELVNFFFKSQAGLVILFLLILAFVIGIAITQRKQGEIVDNIKQTKVEAERTFADVTEYNQPAAPPKAARNTPKQQPKTDTEQETLTVLPTDLYTANVPRTSPESAPSFRLIKCLLVNSVDSINLNTPIIGLVKEPLSWNEQVLIPAGAEVHGTAQNNGIRDRIGDNGTWTIVWTDETKRELQVEATALHHAPEYDVNGRLIGWHITDGSSGLKGDVITSDDLVAIKLFVARFLSGTADGLRDTESTTTDSGNVIESTTGSLQNGLATGLRDAINTYSAQILRQIQQDGVYVRVPPSTEFKLYIRQPIDLAQAKPAAISKPQS